MRCPRCTLADLNENTQTCALCGYSHAGGGPVSPAPPTPTELDARRELAREFQIERLLEPASVPIAYLARDAAGRALVLKAVPLTQLGLPPDRALAALESAARLDHPHIIPVHDSGTTEHFLWYATKLVEGRSLDSSLGTVGPIELPVCLRMFEQIASALEYAHRRGVAHGALRPECILVDANEWVLVGEFGTAGLLGPASGRPAAGDGGAADQSALAQIALQCLTGTANGNGSTTPGNGHGGHAGHAAVPLHVAQALRRATSVQPADRFPSTLDFVAALGGRGEEGGRAEAAAAQTKPSSAPPDPAPAWFSAKPRSGRGSGPRVIADSDEDPAASHWRKRVAAAAGLVLTLGAGATWLGLSSGPPTPAISAVTTAPKVTPRTIPQGDTTTLPRATAAIPTRVISPARVAPPPPPAAPLVTRASPPPRPPIRAPAPAQSWTPAPAPVSAASRAEPALLSVNAIPWGSVYLDGRAVGNTPQIDVTLTPGAHRLRVEREGFKPYERMIAVAPGQRLRITDIALVER